MYNMPEEMNMSKYDFDELLQETLEEITLHCGLLVDIAILLNSIQKY